MTCLLLSNFISSSNDSRWIYTASQSILEFRDWNSEIESRTSEVGERRSEVGDRTSEVGDRTSEVRVRIAKRSRPPYFSMVAESVSRFELLLPTSDLRLPISVLRVPMSDLRLTMSYLRLSISDLRSPMADFRLTISDFPLRLPKVSMTQSGRYTYYKCMIT